MAAIRSYDEYPFGLSWVMDEAMRRTSHALVDDGRVWLVDPVDAPEALERVSQLGEPAAVVQLLDRHNRDCGAIAQRLGVPHLKVPDVVPDSPFEAIAAVRVPRWNESALWWHEREALVVAEVLGTSTVYTGGRGAVGIHPFLRVKTPSSLRGMRPQHLLVGHGGGVHGEATPAEIERAFANAWRDIPHVLRSLPGAMRG